MVDSGTSLAAMKYVSKLVGVDCGGARKPFKELTKEYMIKLEQAVRDNAF